MLKRKRPIKWHRVNKRIRRHHLPLAFIVTISLALVYWAVGSDVLFRLSMSTAYVGLALLAITLMTGALHVIRKRPNPVSSDLTRDIGIWAGLVSLAHVVFGFQRHFAGKIWLYFVTGEPDFPYVRFGWFGIANYSGLIATLILVLLFVTSNDWSLRRLGTKKWKQWQRWNYGLFILVALHGIMYRVNAGQELPYTYILAAMVLATVAIQLAGFVSRRRQLER